jgi:DNA-binding winged helix-turn-helix (wHTH) protein
VTPAHFAGELGGISTAAELLRHVSLTGSVVLAASDTSPDSELIEEICAEHAWHLVKVGDPEAAGWASTIQKTSLLVVVGSSNDFALAVTKAVRRSTSDLVLPVGLPSHELSAQLIALLRRATETWQPTVRFLSAGELQVDLWARQCAVADQPVALSPTEFELLVYLMRHAHQAIPTGKIVQRIWHNWGYADGLNALRIHISRLRRKIDAVSATPAYIRSIRGVGYQFTQSVLEVGDGPNEDAVQQLSELTLSSLILDIARQLQTRPVATAADFVVEMLVRHAGCDAAAVFRSEHDRMVLVAERGNSAEWREAMRDGVPLRSGFAQVHAAQTAQPTQIADIGLMARQYSETARILSRDGFHSCLFLPIVDEVAGGWGGLGLASRTQRPFDPAVTIFCSAVASLFSLAVRGGPVEQLSTVAPALAAAVSLAP